MKTNKFISSLIAIVAVVIVAAVLFGNNGTDYSAAFERTSKLESYKLKINTIVTLDDNGAVKQSIIDQDVAVSDRGRNSMRYEVVTTATSTDTSDGKVVEENNSYLYHNGNYYYSYPGVKYKSGIDHIAAQENIVNLTNVITFSPEKMYNTEIDGNVYEYQVEYDDISAYAKNVLSNAVNLFESGSFALEDILATATVEGEYVTERSLYILYSDGDGRSVSVEIYTELTDTSAQVDAPDESKYASITK